MPYANTRSEHAYISRKDIVASYHTLIEEIIEKHDAESYYVNFLFNSLPGKESTKIDIMEREVTRFHGLL
jgi:hypothetical protein